MVNASKKFMNYLMQCTSNLEALSIFMQTYPLEAKVNRFDSSFLY